MKATGIVRRIDDLGRIVVPKEIRRVLRIREGDPLEIFTNNSGEVILKKYSPISDLSEFASEYTKAASAILGETVSISDTDQFIAASGKRKREFIDKKIDFQVDDIIQSKSNFTDDKRIVVPILYQGDPIGSVTVVSDDDTSLGELELKMAQFGAAFLAEQMEC